MLRLFAGADMPLFTKLQCIDSRHAYSYTDAEVAFVVQRTPAQPYAGAYQGIYPATARTVQSINLRKFEKILQAVFRDYDANLADQTFREVRLENLKQAANALVHWKMASQGGRASDRSQNVMDKWDESTPTKLMGAYKEKDLAGFKIGGVRIPTATTFMRFLWPTEFGIMDSRVAATTNRAKVTSIRVRGDGYILDNKHNVDQYESNYINFLRSEAAWLNSQGARFTDYDENGIAFESLFRPCDVEMALYRLQQGTATTIIANYSAAEAKVNP
jgi:hypothetical protein